MKLLILGLFCLGLNASPIAELQVIRCNNYNPYCPEDTATVSSRVAVDLTPGAVEFPDFLGLVINLEEWFGTPAPIDAGCCSDPHMLRITAVGALLPGLWWVRGFGQDGNRVYIEPVEVRIPGEIVAVPRANNPSWASQDVGTFMVGIHTPRAPWQDGDPVRVYAVPEPSSAFLVCPALLAVLFAFRRRSLRC